MPSLIETKNYIISEPARPKACIIWLHGLGASGHDLAEGVRLQARILSCKQHVCQRQYICALQWMPRESRNVGRLVRLLRVRRRHGPNAYDRCDRRCHRCFHRLASRVCARSCATASGLHRKD